MEKTAYRSIGIVISLVVIFSVVVIAAGGGGGGSIQREPVEEPKPSPAEQCETYSTVNKRVACRLQYGQAKESVPEACRILSNSQSCQELYRNSIPCYSKNGKDKDKCFKQLLKFKGARLKDQSNEQVRNYLLLLLYDLEEKVEDAYDAGKISEDNAAYVITTIVEIKEKVLQNKPASEIRSSLQTLKSIWKSEMQ